MCPVKPVIASILSQLTGFAFERSCVRHQDKASKTECHYYREMKIYSPKGKSIDAGLISQSRHARLSKYLLEYTHDKECGVMHQASCG
jgi:hypothetical protein